MFTNIRQGAMRATLMLSALSFSMASGAITVDSTSFDLVGGGLGDGGDTSSLANLAITPGSNGIGLDEAIIAANNSGGGSIDFDAGIAVLSPGDDMPSIAATTNIDGGGAVTLIMSGDNPTVPALDVTAGNGGIIQGLTIDGSGNIGIALGGTSQNYQILDCTIINSNSHGIQIMGDSGSGGHTIRRCFIGTDGTSSGQGNGSSGIYILDSSGNTIGATGLSERNVISGNNSFGIYLSAFVPSGVAENNGIYGNYIGTNSAGTASIPNFNGGIVISNASNNMIGSPSTSEIQVISGNGSSIGDGITIQAFSGGTAENNEIHGNYIGVDSTGNANLGNQGDGVLINAASNNMVGSPTSGKRQIISGNTGAGVHILTQSTGDVASGNGIYGNYIGINKDGNTSISNSQGVYLQAGSGDANSLTLTEIGKAGNNARNVISGNNTSNVYLSGSTLSNTNIYNNYIGTTADGTARVSVDSGHGIDIMNGATGTSIGDDTGTHGNLISGNDVTGIYISSSSNNSIVGNMIGTGLDGVSDLGNGGDGIVITSPSSDAADNIIGGSLAGANYIAHNLGWGIRLSRATSNVVRTTMTYNSIFSNSSGPVRFDIGSENESIPTPGANTLIGYPHMVAVNSVPAADYQVQVYADLGLQAEMYLTEAVSTAAGTLMIPVDIAPLDGYQIRVAWTDPSGNTSRFSGVAVGLTVAPTLFVEVKSGQADPTNAEPIFFDVTADEEIMGLDSTDFENAGTAGEPTYALTNPSLDNKTFLLEVTNVPGDGTILPLVTAGKFTDLSSNASTSDSIQVATDGTVTFDTTPPIVTVNLLSTSDSTPPLSGTVDDPTATISVNVGSQAGLAATNNGDGTWTLPDDTLTILADGAYNVMVTATDLAGNAASDSSSNELTIDTTPPTVTVDGKTTNDARPELTGAVNDPTASILIDVGGQTGLPATNNGDGTWTLADNTISPSLPDGVYDVMVSAIDALSNTGMDGTSNELTIDTTAPIVAVNSLETNDTSPELTGTVNDPTATVIIDVASQIVAAANNGDGTWTLADGTLTAVAPGTYNVTATATDPAGNVGTDGSTGELTIDTDPPTIVINPPSASETSVGPVSFAATVTGADLIDIGDGNVMLNSTGTATGTINVTNGTSAAPTVTINDISGDGTLSITILAGSASDTAGNENADAGPSATFTVDNTAPTIAIGKPSPSVTTTGGSVTFMLIYSGADSVLLQDSDVVVSTSGTATATATVTNGTTTTPTVTLGSISGDGALEISILAGTAMDALGNTSDEAGPSAMATVDTTAPVVTVDALVTKDTTPALSGTVNEAGATVVIDVDAQTGLTATNNGDGTWDLADDTLTALAEGTFDVVATATDGVGNIGVDSTTNELTVDLTAPTVTVNSLTTSDTTPTVSGTVTDLSAVTVQVTVNGIPYTANVSGGTWTADVTTTLGGATYDIMAVATDAAGNSGSDGTTNELTVNSSIPVVTINTMTTSDQTPRLTGGATSSAAINSVVVTVNGVNIDASVSGGVWTADVVNPLPAGTYDVTVRATNILGQVTTRTFTGALVIDLSTPVVSVNFLTTNDATPTLTGTVTDGTSVTISVMVAGQTVNGTVSGTTWSATIITAIGDGTYDVQVTGTDSSSNVGTDTTTNELTIDTVAPTATAITLAGDNPTNGASVDFAVLFDDSVNGVDVTDFVVVVDGQPQSPPAAKIDSGDGPLPVTVAGEGDSYTVSVGTGSGDGTIGLQFVNDGTIVDGASNSLAPSLPAEATYTIDKTAPSVMISSTEPDPTSNAAIPIRIAFSEPVSLLEASQVVLSNGAFASFDSLDGANYQATIEPVASGVVSASIGAGAVADGAGNVNDVGATFAITYEADSGVEDCLALCNPEEAVDGDGDGLSACEEACYGTDDTLTDTDGDGMPDSFEVEFGLNPVVDDSQGDLDEDGVNNLGEFLGNSDPADPQSPNSTLFVDPAGSDVTGTGSPASPFQSIGHAIEQSAPAIGFPSRVIVRAGTYVEDITMRARVIVEGQSRSDVVIMGQVIGASRSEIRNLTITPAGDETYMLDMNRVFMNVIQVDFLGTPARDVTGMMVDGDLPQNSVIDLCTFMSLGVGIDIGGAGPTIRRCTFGDIPESFGTPPRPGAAIIFRATGEVVTTKSIGDQSDPETGWNDFLDTIEGMAVINERDESIEMQSNYWGVDNIDDAEMRVSGPSNLVPILTQSSAVLAASLFCTVWQQSDQKRIGNAELVLEVSAFKSVTDNDNGVYAFPAMSEGQYTVVVNSLGFEEQRMDVTVQSGELKSVTIAMRASNVGGEGEGEGDGDGGCNMTEDTQKMVKDYQGNIFLGGLTILAMLLTSIHYRREKS